MFNKSFYLILWSATFILACKSRPVIVEAESESAVEDAAPAAAAASQELHEVEVLDIQNIGKYTYLHAKEKDRTFCVAIPLNEEIKTGNTYYYRGGLIMANPEILKFKEKFETVYIVASISENPLTANNNFLGEVNAAASGPPPGGEIKPVNIVPAPGVVKLAELIKNSARYEGKTIKVQGQCVKLNRMIMNKNWLHIQDNSVNAEGKKYDLTITTMEEVQLGEVVILEGKIAINKDFGAGYKYEVILEDAVRK